MSVNKLKHLISFMVLQFFFLLDHVLYRIGKNVTKAKIRNRNQSRKKYLMFRSNTYGRIPYRSVLTNA